MKRQPERLSGKLKDVIKSEFDMLFVYRAANKHQQAVKQMNKLYEIFEQIPDHIEYDSKRLSFAKVFWRKKCTKKKDI
jgi:elongation factor P--beta-lysine ligase